MKNRRQKAEGRRQDAQPRGEDWVDFDLKESAPNYIALGGARFSGTFRRGAGPFRATHGEWKVFLEPTGWFEKIGPSDHQAIEPSKSQSTNGSSDEQIARSSDEPIRR